MWLLSPPPRRESQPVFICIPSKVVIPGQAPKYAGLGSAIVLIAREEGVMALWKGLTPRLMRIMPGQAITFMTYEWVSSRLPSFL